MFLWFLKKCVPYVRRQHLASGRGGSQAHRWLRSEHSGGRSSRCQGPEMETHLMCWSSYKEINVAEREWGSRRVRREVREEATASPQGLALLQEWQTSTGGMKWEGTRGFESGQWRDPLGSNRSLGFCVSNHCLWKRVKGWSRAGELRHSDATGERTVPLARVTAAAPGSSHSGYSLTAEPTHCADELDVSWKRKD